MLLAKAYPSRSADIIFLQSNAVNVDDTVLDRHCIARDTNNALDKLFLGISWILKDYDVPSGRFHKSI